MRCTCFYVPWLIPIYSWKSPLQISTNINFCDKARSLGAARTDVRFPLWPGGTGTEPLCLQMARSPRSNRFEKGSADSRRSLSLLAIRKEQMSFPQKG
jgi:hypothetical protein